MSGRPLRPHASDLAHAIEAHLTPARAAEVLATATQPHRTPEEVIDAVIDQLDALIPWPAIVPGWGILLEAADGPALKALVHLLLSHRAKHEA